MDKSKVSLSEYYNATDKYLMLGNGINLLSKGFSWDELLINLCKRVGLDSERNHKPYSLFFEEISFELDKNKTIEENIKTLKKIIGEEALKLRPNNVLREIIAKKYYSHFLSTNYDYCIENALLPGYESEKGKNRKIPKYSLYRYNLVNSTKIWHIHGEIDNGRRGDKEYPEASILIGFEHYSDYLEKIHRLLKSDTGKGLAEQMKSAKENWVHIFFTHNIDIIGFGLDFTENHLWFIINFRARLKRKKARIHNTIRWIIPQFSLDKDKMDLLQALDIQVLQVQCIENDYEDFYRNFINSF